MNFKLFKKIIINLLKFVQISLGAIVDLLIKGEDILIALILKLEVKEPEKPLPTYEEQDYIGDSYIGEHIRDKRMME